MTMTGLLWSPLFLQGSVPISICNLDHRPGEYHPEPHFTDQKT